MSRDKGGDMKGSLLRRMRVIVTDRAGAPCQAPTGAAIAAERSTQMIGASRYIIAVRGEGSDRAG